jgi:Skp family chaperone for outer membrane proteins
MKTEKRTTMTSKLLCAAAALFLLPAAQAVAAPAADAPLVQAAPIPGMCIFSNARTLGASTVGKAADARLQQLRNQLGGALGAERAALDKDIKAFQARRASLPQAQLQAQGSALQTRANALEQKTELQNRQLEITAQKAKQTIESRIAPIITNLYQSRHCAVLENGEMVIAANPAMDITPDVVRALDAAMPTISFELEPLPTK